MPKQPRAPTTDSTGAKGRVSSDPQRSRHATASIAGYAYQLFRSLYAWISLGSDELLFLEGAEDFDVITPFESEAIQVKHSSKPTRVSLRSKVSVEVLNNFWVVSQNNPNVRVLYRLLTTATPTRERGKPFGLHSGIAYWGLCQQGKVEVAKLRSFLLTSDELSGDLVDFLHQSDDRELLDRLVSRVTWDTGNLPASYVETAIEQSLSSLGEKYGVMPSAAGKVRDRLFREVIAVASRDSNRFLSRVDLLQLFEEGTTERVPRRVAIESLSMVPVPFSLDAGPPPPIAARSLIQEAAPPLPPNIATRASLTAEIAEVLREERLAVLTGSTGMGKTSLANLVTQQEPADWHWVQMRGFGATQLPWLLRMISSFVDQQAKPVNLVLDDYPADAVEWEGALGALLFAVLARSGRAVVTSYRKLSSQLASTLSVADRCFIELPPLSEEDISEMVLGLGCTDPTRLQQWSRLLLLQTAGHPQLVHAGALGARDQAFPEPAEQDLLQRPEQVTEARERARLLLARIGSEEGKRLAYALSPMVVRFRRDQAIAIGEGCPGVDLPGEAFDRLIGPWVEQVDGSYFRVSQLIRNAAADVFGPKEIQKLHVRIATAIVQTGNLSQTEAEAILFHGMMGKCDHLVGRLVTSLLSAQKEVRVALAHSAQWILALSLDAHLYPENLAVGNLLRALQFELAEIADVVSAPDIGRTWEKETRAADPGRLEATARIHCLSRLCVSLDARFGPAEIVGWLVELDELYTRLRSELGDQRDAGLPPLPEIRKFLPSIFLLASNSISTRHELTEFVRALGEVRSELRRELLERFDSDEFFPNVLLGRVWLHEYEKSAPDWDKCIEAFLEVHDSALSWGALKLASASARLIAVVHTDNLDDAARAERVIRDALVQFPKSRWLRAQLALVLQSLGRADEAMRLYEEILPGWHPTKEVPDTQSIFTRQSAAICAAQSENWDKAGAYFLAGSKDAALIGQKAQELGMLADSAYSAAMADEPETMIGRFSEVIRALETIGPLEREPGLFRVSKQLGHVLMWLAYEPEINDLAPPYPGMCSNQQHHEEILKLNPTPLEIMWSMLCEIEEKRGSKTTIKEQVRDRLSSTPVRAARAIFLASELKRSFRSGDFATLPKVLVDHFAGVLEQQAENESSASSEKDGIRFGIQEVLKWPEIGLRLKQWFVAALLKLASVDRLEEAPFDSWIRSANDIGLGDQIGEFLEDARAMLLGDFEAAVRLVRDTRVDLLHRSVASVMVGAGVDATAEELFIAHSIWFLALPQQDAGIMVPDAVEKLAVRTWTRAVEQRALLRNPSVVVPAILSECQSKRRGWAKVAGLLIEARPAVKTRFPDGMLEELEEIAGR